MQEGSKIFNQTDLKKSLQAAEGLVFFRCLHEHSAFKAWSRLLQALLEQADVIGAYSTWLAELTPFALKTSQDAWLYFMDYELMMVDNELTRLLQSGEEIPSPLLTALDREAGLIAIIRETDAHLLRQAAQTATGRDLPLASGWGSEPPSIELDWAGAGELVRSYRELGSGLPALCRVMRWESRHGLIGIDDPDPVELSDLIGYQRQKDALVRNTERLLSGLPAHHALLYGPRGSGKSSMVKAVANRFTHTPLRLVEVNPGDLGELPVIVDCLQGRAQKFIIFVDDLSFEAYETVYRSLKALLEGGVETRPDNLAIYATSNRRHIVQEYYSDRLGDDDLHPGETRQEKLALADRFGLSIFFPSADQELYLEMVRSLARRRGININEQELESRALTWEKERSGPSGRTARQFVDSL